MTRSRVEADREDLLAEAANLVERMELELPDFTAPITAGRNRQGHWSFYIGPEPMSRFDAAGGLRRAVRQGKLYRTQGNTLAELTRVRLDHETQLQRRDLSPTEAHEVLQAIHAELSQLAQAITHHKVRVLRQVGAGSTFFEELSRFLTQLTSQALILAAALPTKKH